MRPGGGRTPNMARARRRLRVEGVRGFCQSRECLTVRTVELFFERKRTLTRQGVASPAFFMNTMQEKLDISPYLSYILRTRKRPLIKPCIVRTRDKVLVIDLSQTSIAGAIGNHGGLLRIDYCRDERHQPAAAVHESSEHSAQH